MAYVQVEAGRQSTKTAVVDEAVSQADRQEVQDGLIRSFRYKGNALAGSTGLSPASSGVGKRIDRGAIH